MLRGLSCENRGIRDRSWPMRHLLQVVMGDRLDSLSPEALDAETRRLRRLTRGLLYEQHDAEDVVQESWLTVLRRDRENPRSLSGWLTATVRRLASSTHKSRTCP